MTVFSNQLSMGKNTVQRYLDLLEKTFVVFSRMGFSRNQRKEVVKNRRYYFLRQRHPQRRYQQLLPACPAR